MRGVFLVMRGVASLVVGRPPNAADSMHRRVAPSTAVGQSGRIYDTPLPLRSPPIPMRDWTLLSIHLDWAAAEATLLLLDRTSAQRRLVARGLTFFHLEREEPWGPSNSIDEMTQMAGASGQPLALSMKMPSGDWIRLGAASIHIEQV